MKRIPILFAFRRRCTAALPIAILLWMGGCKTATSPGNAGAFAGRIALFDSTGTTLNDFSGTTVQIDGTNFNTTTSADGSWKIDNVPEGQYNVSATKAGFGTFHWYEEIVNGGTNDLVTAALARVPKLSLNFPTPQFTQGVLMLGGYQEAAPAGYMVAQYVDLDSTVQPSDSHLAISIGEEYISINDLRTAGAQPGQTLYVSYAWAFDTFGLYDFGHYQYSFYDPSHHETRYASNGPKSQVFAVTMP